LYSRQTRIAAFTFIRNALRYDYPIVEAIKSVLPLCDYFSVAVGKCDDGTLDLVRGIADPRLHIVETEWDDSLRAGGRVLALETDKAFDAIPKTGFDWCFYIQGDECIHEADLPVIRDAMERYKDDPATEGLLFDYRHFYGSYDYVGISRRWYRREVRVIRHNPLIRSYRDAQGFRLDGRKLRVRAVPAHIHHYGWVKHPAAQQAKQLNFNKLWHSDAVVRDMVGEAETYAYDGALPLERFTGTHPAVMLPRIQAANWQFSGDPAAARWSFKDRFSRWIEQKTGRRPGEYKNYAVI
jgi:hypothetical protein